ncbi:uncharacterized protein LOC127750905 [Frankliniella occidentalis]|uniref:Uncharacterized protein LOC127750905 n=1 Tax=Frankliniella occidentalis TaxID=133901 RepID=A0A9C6X5L7_FRAOC|nr:uncharacterized protein LOC127750905 [Frankliniella occidentalis]
MPVKRPCKPLNRHFNWREAGVLPSTSHAGFNDENQEPVAGGSKKTSKRGPGRPKRSINKKNMTKSTCRDKSSDAGLFHRTLLSYVSCCFLRFFYPFLIRGCY